MPDTPAPHRRNAYDLIRTPDVLVVQFHEGALRPTVAIALIGIGLTATIVCLVLAPWWTLLLTLPIVLIGVLAWRNPPTVVRVVLSPDTLEIRRANRVVSTVPTSTILDFQATMRRVSLNDEPDEPGYIEAQSCHGAGEPALTFGQGDRPNRHPLFGIGLADDELRTLVTTLNAWLTALRTSPTPPSSPTG